MDCQTFTTLLVDYVEDELPQRTMELCNEHHFDCRDCEAYAASYQETIQLARDASRERVSTAKVESLIARVLQRIVLAT